MIDDLEQRIRDAELHSDPFAFNPHTAWTPVSIVAWVGSIICALCCVLEWDKPSSTTPSGSRIAMDGHQKPASPPGKVQGGYQAPGGAKPTPPTTGSGVAPKK